MSSMTPATIARPVQICGNGSTICVPHPRSPRVRRLTGAHDQLPPVYLPLPTLQPRPQPQPAPVPSPSPPPSRRTGPHLVPVPQPNPQPSPAPSPTTNQQPQIFYHYGRHEKIAFILASQTIPFSDQLTNPTRARHGSGVYLTDITPGTLTKAQIAYQLYGAPHRGNQAHVEGWVAIDTRGMDVIFTGKQHIYLVPTDVALPVADKIVGSGVTP